MKVRELITILEELAPPELACSWDNVGLQVGRLEAEVHKVYVALDGDDEGVEAAIAAGCDFLLTHHPFIFNPIRKVNEETLEGRRLLRLMEKGVACYSMHTSYDAAPEGMADRAAGRLGLKNAVPMEPDHRSDLAGLGRIGVLEAPMTVKELVQLVKQVFRLPYGILYGGEGNRIVQKVAILPGSGKSEIELAIRLGAEFYITGDVGHHSGIDSAAWGLPVLDAGHAGIEWIFVPELTRYLKERTPELEVIPSPLRLPGKLI